MEIIKVNIEIKNNKSTIAEVSIETIDGVDIHNIFIVQSKKGIEVKWPTCIKFINKELKKNMSNRVLAHYVLNHCDNIAN